MIKPVNYSSSNSINFSARAKAIKTQISSGNLKYSTASQMTSLKNAVKDILSKSSQKDVSQKIKAVLNKFNILLQDNITILSALGAGSAVTLFLSNNDKKEECLGINVETPKTKVSYLVDGNKVMELNNGKVKYLTNEVIEKSSIEDFLQKISSSVDLPLLRLRQAQQPEVVPYIPLYTYDVVEKTKSDVNSVEGESISKTIKDDNIPEDQTFVVEPISIRVDKVIENPRKFDTFLEVDKLLQGLRNESCVTTSPVQPKGRLKTTNSQEIGRLSSNTQNLLNDILYLFSIIDTAYEQKGSSMLTLLKKNIPSFSSYRKDSSITLQNIGPDGSGLTFVKSHSKKHNGRDVVAIYKRNIKGEITDVIPISEDKVYKMIKSFSLDRSDKFVNFVSVKYCLSQEEIESKNLNAILSKLKNELEYIVRTIDSRDAVLNSELLGQLERIDNKRIKLKEKEANALTAATPAFQTLKKGGLFFSRINTDGDNLVYIDAKENKHFPGATLLKVTDRIGMLKKCWVIKDGKVLKNYNGRSNNYPKEYKYLNQLELEKMNCEAEIKECLNYIESNFEFSEKILNSYDDIKAPTRRKRHFNI